jgi:hypothetical protein
MPEASTKVHRLRTELRQSLDLDRPLTESQILGISDRIAEMLLRAFADDDHPLAKELAELLEVRPPRKTQRKVPRARVLFLPYLGGDSRVQRFWPLQLLLLTASQSPKHAAALAERLNLSPTSMRRSAKQAAGFLLWSPRQYLGFLEQAVQILDVPETIPPIRLEGCRVVSFDGNKFRLGRSQCRLLQLLIEHIGSVVTYQQIAEAGVYHAKQTKERLAKTFTRHGVHLPIETVLKGYRLPENWK